MFPALSLRGYKVTMNLEPSMLRYSRNLEIPGVLRQRKPVGVLNTTHALLHVNQVAFEVAEKSSRGNEDEDEDGDDPKAGSPTGAIPAGDRFLQRDDQGLWKLGPLPESGIRVDHAKALHVYIAQQWSEWAKFIKICSLT